ncbi:Nod factor-specific ABC transporter NodJ protein [Streptomyces sp. 846.5]|nr:ABC transporter ATP-binding protein/permease [Streptomyces sp. 846.5]TDU04471.1 Nod factor-specific ABC transporter NodJ protein [Streptomyces sp. 846.5]
MTERSLAVSARGVTRRHGDKQAVSGVDLDVPSASCFGIVGQNGAGKTTLMRMLSCTLVPDSGTMEILGVQSNRDPRAIKARIGVVPQGMTLDPELRVRENLTAFARYHGLDRAEANRRSEEGLESVGLADHAANGIEELSGGMQRRLLIARAMISRPALLLLDEPTTGLDPESRVVIWDQLSRLRQAGTTVVITSHYLDEIERLCDLVAVMHDGLIRQSITPGALLNSTMTERVVEFAGAGLTAEAVASACIELPHRLHRVGDRFLLLTDQPEEAARMIRERGLSGETRVRQSRLEDSLLTFDHSDTGAPSSTAEPACGSPRLPSAPRPTLARHVWNRNAAMFRRAYRTSFIPNFFEPVLYLLAFGAGLGNYIDPSRVGGSYAQYVAPGLLAISAMNGAVFEVTYNIFVRLRHSRIYDAVITTPMEPRDIALGELLWSLTRCTAYGAVFLALIAVAGLATAPTAPLALLAFPLIGLTFAGMGMLFTARAHAINAYSYFYTLALTPLTMCSGAFFPLDSLPEPLRIATWFNPLHHGVELIRALVRSGDLGQAAAQGSWLAVTGLLLLVPALRSLDRHLVG